MKSYLFPFMVIICLILLFVIIDHKEIMRHSNSYEIQTNNINQPTSVKITRSEKDEKEETKQVETKHIIDKETVAINKLSKGEVSNKHSDTKHGDQLKPRDKSAPAAVPAATIGETERLNSEAVEYAIAEKEKMEPFYNFYRDKLPKTVIFEGTVRTASNIPTPETNDYDNCLYALFVEIDSLLSDLPEDIKISYEIVLNVPIMKDKTILQDKLFFPGDKIWCMCSEYDTMPQMIQEIQLSDDIQSFEYQQCYAIKICKISSFNDTGNKSFSKREISILPIQSIPKDETVTALRKERLRSEIARIENELEKHGGSFQSWKEEYKTIAQKYNKLVSEKFSGWINDSYFSAGGKETSYSTKEYIDGILPYKQYLEENNIDLIVVRIPSKWDFAARVLSSENYEENPEWVEHYYQCLKNDIEIVDPMPEMWKERFAFPLFYFYNASEEVHPFEGQAFVSAKELSNILKRYQYQKTEQEIILTDFTFQTDQSRYFWPPGNKRFDPQQNISFKTVFQNNKSIGHLVPSSGSPFLFLSNSFFVYPQRDMGASVPGYTAYFIQAVPDWYYQDGTHNPMIRNLIARPQLLNFRKAVIMVGHPDDWKGFPSIPRYIQDKAKHITLEKTLNAFSDEIIIHDNDSYLYSIDKNDVVSFTPNNKPHTQRVNHFDMFFTIPYIEGKNTCMIRVNFDRTAYITLILSPQNSDTLIDTISLSPGVNMFADLFVPLSNRSQEVKISFQPTINMYEYTIKNIELWYY